MDKKTEKYMIEQAKKVLSYQKDPFLFIKDMWGLTPQQPLQEHEEKWKEALKNNDSEGLTLNMFEPFIMGKHITWQQTMIINAIKKGINGEDSWKISVSSGHGIGKSCTMAWITLWGLFCFKGSQIPCTAPTETQMKDVLWAEVGIWLEKMPDPVKQSFEKISNYIRVAGQEKRFARAKTGRKEDSEALAGVHSPSLVMLIIDEASGVPEEVFKSSKGALSSPNVLQLMISNPTRVEGYFYDSHHRLSEGFQTFTFSGVESPVVDRKLIQDIITEHGTESDEYKIRILGEFPSEDGIDDEGWFPLITKKDLEQAKTTDGGITPFKLGIDPAKSGVDNSIWVARDSFKAKIVCKEKVSTPKSISSKTLTLMTEYQGIYEENITVDNFGVGAEVTQELGLARKRVRGINVGEKGLTRNKKRFINPRAEAFWAVREWIKKGGQLVNDKLWDDILIVRYKKDISGKIVIMPKKDMKKKYGKSPDTADALMLTFIVPDKEDYNEEESIVADYSDML